MLIIENAIVYTTTIKPKLVFTLQKKRTFIK